MPKTSKMLSAASLALTLSI